jgi:hypothetical protein
MRQSDLTSTVTRRCTYHIASRTTVLSMDDSVRWAQALDPLPPRQVYVTKDLDPDTGQERVVYKVLGYLYAVADREIFCIGYRHLLTMTVEPGEQDECEE